MNTYNKKMLSDNKHPSLKGLTLPHGLQVKKPPQNGGNNQYTKISDNDSPYLEENFSQFLSILHKDLSEKTRKTRKNNKNRDDKKTTKKIQKNN